VKPLCLAVREGLNHRPIGLLRCLCVCFSGRLSLSS
jgi:hypothetical protein